MPLLGAHMSIAGGLHKAVEAAVAHGMDTLQIFTFSPSQWSVSAIPAAELGTAGGPKWRGKPLAGATISGFRSALKASGLSQPVAHNSYLINLASPDNDLWQKSLDAMTCELERAEALGLMGVVMHPGSFVSSTEAAGLERITLGLNQLHRDTAGYRTLTLLETTAGQGTNLGHRFEHLQQILDTVADPERLGICLDTCHIFAAGYPLDSAEDYEETMAEFDRRIGLSRIKAFHLNDSVKPRGSRVDRHAHIGEGQLGLNPFRHLLRDRRFATTPMFLETAKGDRDGESLDAINMRVLRSLL